MDKNNLLEKLNPTRINYLKIVTKPSSNLSVYDSKIGGIPYWPKDKEYPYFDKNIAKLICQINFSELSKKFDLNVINPYLPKTGLLQFFIKNDDFYGLSFESDISSQCHVQYHENLLLPHSLTFNEEQENLIDDDMPYNEQLELNFLLNNEILGPSDLCNLDKFSSIIPDFDNLDDDLMDWVYDNVSNEGSKIGGYAHFTQQDNWIKEKYSNNMFLLLQLDTDENIMWGDSGVANWRISEEDLKQMNFTNILYNWDCC